MLFPEKKRIMKLYGVPAPVIAQVMMPAVKKFDAEFTVPIRSLAAGATAAAPQPAKKCCIVQ